MNLSTELTVASASQTIRSIRNRYEICFAEYKIQAPRSGTSETEATPWALYPPLSGSAIREDRAIRLASGKKAAWPSGSAISSLEHVFTARQFQHLPPTGSRRYPRYIFVGDQPGESEIGLGIFAGLLGEDDVGAKAIVEFIDDLVAMPCLGSAFRIYAYPTVNPLIYTAGTSRKQTEAAFADKIGRKVKFPEALIKREVFVVQFHGLVVIHTTDKPEGLQAAVYGANLREADFSNSLLSSAALPGN